MMAALLGRLSCVIGLLLTAVCLCSPARLCAQEHVAARFIDLSLMDASHLPCTWAGPEWPLFQINHYMRIGPLSAYNSDILAMDTNTGTQLDVPPHSIPPPDSNLPDAGPFGLEFTDKVPAWKFVGGACVIDATPLLDKGANGRSSLITKELITAWEQKHRPLGPSDVVLFHSGYSDKYFRPFPAGRRFIADPVDGKSPGWPDPDPGAMEYLASRGVMTLGTDSPSMGPIPDLAAATHTAGLKYGMIWTESATGLGSLPVTGAFYCMMGPKHSGCPGSEARAFAIAGDPLARTLIESVRKKNVVDLSVVLSDRLPVWWPGRGAGNNRHPYFQIPFLYDPKLKTHTQFSHMLDSNTGTHLVVPAFALPPEGFNNNDYDPKVRKWLSEYEKKYGPRGTSDITTEKVPISQTCGWARIIDVRHLAGTTDRKTWPASPEITAAEIKKYEREHGALKPSEIVVFYTGYTDTYFKPFPEGKACMIDPLNGVSEGWPAPGPDAITYLASRGIRCVASDGPTLGGADPRQALMTYWALGTKGMVGVEFLTDVGKLPERAYFLFAPVKIRGCHGGPGRALALYEKK
jgi:kynurenine formamidase